MNILLFDQSELQDNQLILNDRRAEHIRKILRAGCGDQLKAGQINGPIGRATIQEIDKKRIILQVELNGPLRPRPVTSLILALPRPIMLKRILSQATTLGVSNIYLINSRRVEKSFFHASLLEENNMLPHLLHGLEQAGDTWLPEVSIHQRFKPFIEDLLPEISENSPARLVAHPEATSFLPELIKIPLQQKVLLAIGPEGGWIDYEIDKFKEQGFQPFTLGPRILRVDTAVISLLAQLDLLRNSGLKAE